MDIGTAVSGSATACLCLSALPASPPRVDPLLEAILLRHRPACLVPLAWHTDERGRVLLVIDRRGLETLADRLDDYPRDRMAGYRLLESILEAMELALDRFLILEPSLLRPDLIFLPEGPEPALDAARIVCLPFELHDPEEGTGETLLIDRLAAYFTWDQATRDHFRRLFARRAYSDLREALKAMTEPLEEEGKEGEGVVARRQAVRRPLVSWLKALSQTLGRLGGHDSIHETTRELNLTPGAYRIAQLSEGLPGTPEEADGLRAYILTEDFLVGRELGEADLGIDSEAVSRLHARISLKGGCFFIEDLGSRNGTCLDGVRLARHREYLLPDRCRIAFAGHPFYFRCE